MGTQFIYKLASFTQTIVLQSSPIYNLAYTIRRCYKMMQDQSVPLLRLYVHAVWLLKTLKTHTLHLLIVLHLHGIMLWWQNSDPIHKRAISMIPLNSALLSSLYFTSQFPVILYGNPVFPSLSTFFFWMVVFCHEAVENVLVGWRGGGVIIT